jgi:hypothetical protein
LPPSKTKSVGWKTDAGSELAQRVGYIGEAGDNLSIFEIGPLILEPTGVNPRFFLEFVEPVLMRITALPSGKLAIFL